MDPSTNGAASKAPLGRITMEITSFMMNRSAGAAYADANTAVSPDDMPAIVAHVCSYFGIDLEKKLEVAEEADWPKVKLIAQHIHDNQRPRAAAKPPP